MKRFSLLACLVILAGCGGTPPAAVDSATTASPPTPGAATGAPFKLTVYASEYPSWSTFGVAAQQGLIGKEFGQMGPLEKKWNVDLEVKLVSYDACLAAYASQGGAVCITNVRSAA